VLAAARAMPFLSDKRLVLVHGMLAYLGRRGAAKELKAQLKQLVADLPFLPESARLVFVESQTLSASHAAIKLANTEPSGYVKSFDAPKNPTTWIKRRAADYGVEIAPQAVAALVSIIDKDLRKADNEMYKLAAYIGEGGTITEDDVMRLTTYVAETSIFEMVDALGRRDGKTAMRLLHQIIDVDQQDPMQIFGMVVRQFRLLLQAREVLDDGGNAHTISKTMGVHSFVAEKLAQQARGLTLDQLKRIYRNLLENDVNVKRGRVTIDVALDLFVAGVTGQD
jgi:DNA polymerase-3 subunit delta